MKRMPTNNVASSCSTESNCPTVLAVSDRCTSLTNFVNAVGARRSFCAGEVSRCRTRKCTSERNKGPGPNHVQGCAEVQEVSRANGVSSWVSPVCSASHRPRAQTPHTMPPIEGGIGSAGRSSGGGGGSLSRTHHGRRIR